MEDEIEELLV